MPVDDVLKEVADFRLALEADLLIAAAALDESVPEIASDVLEGERRELRDFQDRVLDRLADAAVAEAAGIQQRNASKHRGTRRAARLVASAATVVGLLGAASFARTVSGPVEPASQQSQLALAEQHMDDMSRAALTARPDAAVAAAEELHETLQTLIDEHGSDPEVAQQIVSLLTQDLALIKAEPQLRQVLHEALKLARQLERNAPPKVRATVQPLIAAVTTPPPPPRPSASPSQPPRASASPSPSPSASPSASESSSSDSSGSRNKNNGGDGKSGGENPGGGPLPTPPVG